MALLTWNDRLSVGIREMDEQHKILVELTNQLYDAMGTGQGDHVKSGVLNSLCNRPTRDICSVIARAG